MKNTEVTVKVNVSLSRLDDEPDSSPAAPAALEAPAIMRKLFVGGNWKMNGSFSHIDSFFQTINEADTDPDAGKFHCNYFMNFLDIVIGVPACYMKYAQEHAPKGIKIAAENCYKESSGAFTGEIR